MLEAGKDLPAGIVGVRASGEVSSEDYKRVMEPLLEGARQAGQRLRFLYEIAPETHFTGGAAWEDARIGLQHLRLFDACAVVADVGWVRESIRLVGPFMPCPVRTFAGAERAEAIAWLATAAEASGVSYRLLSDSGVLVIEVSSALRARDFDALAVSADAWIDAHGKLHGVVIHARTFPGWENLAAFLRHVRFVRDHHKKVSRVALVSDARVAELVPRIAEHFVRAELKHFDANALDQAIAWARA